MKDPLERIQQLQRVVATSRDGDALAELLISRSRIEGEQVYLEALQDRLLWNRYPDSVQDRSIDLVAKRLAPSFSLTERRSYQCQQQSHRVATFQHQGSGALLNLIPGGSYQMGTKNLEQELAYCKQAFSLWDQDSIAFETPMHELRIAPMLVGKYPVRQSVWDKIGGEDSRHWNGADLPIEGVSWGDCRSWLQKAGDGLRLVNESEWEYACRAGSTTRYFWGDAMVGRYCWYHDNSHEVTHPVTEHDGSENAFGLVDTLGNVWEWCRDEWFPDYQAGPYDHSFREAHSFAHRVMRGGCWRGNVGGCRAAVRYSYWPDHRGNAGFRLAKTLPSWQ